MDDFDNIANRELKIKEFSSRNEKEVMDELALILMSLPMTEDSKTLLTMVFTEFYHWMFTEPSIKHPRPSDMLVNLLTSARRSTQKYDA